MINQYEPTLSYKDRLAVSEYIFKDVWLTEFKETRELERRIAEFLGVKYCSIVSNGTISLSLALLAGGVRPGDKVIVPNLTMIATATAVTLIGAIPVLVDVNPVDLTLDLEEVKKIVYNQSIKDFKYIKALIYVSLNGRAEECYNFKDLCKQNNILYIGDDAQSLGSLTAKKETLGSIADISSFSFSMPKIITTGQGGCLVTNNEEYYQKILQLRDFGRERTGVDKHPFYGINSKFTDLQAVLGNSQMENLEEKIKSKKDIYNQYQHLLGDIPEIELLATSLTYVTPWFVDIYVDNREELINFLKSEGIGSRPMYPAIHTQGIYKEAKEYPVSDKASQKGLWLPSSLSLTTNEIEMICKKIHEFYER